MQVGTWIHAVVGTEHICSLHARVESCSPWAGQEKEEKTRKMEEGKRSKKEIYRREGEEEERKEVDESAQRRGRGELGGEGGGKKEKTAPPHPPRLLHVGLALPMGGTRRQRRRNLQAVS